MSLIAGDSRSPARSRESAIRNPNSAIEELCMPTWLKVLLIVGGILVVLIVGVVVAGVIVVRRYGPDIVKSVEQTGNEGKEYGRRTDNEGCVNEAVGRHSPSGGTGDLIQKATFLR